MIGKVILYVFMSLCPSLMLSADVFHQSFSSPDYESALKGKSYIRFNMESSKLGFISMEFVGVVKTFTLQASWDERRDVFEDAEVRFSVLDMSTDNGARDRKMYKKCFSYQDFPSLRVALNAPFQIGEEVTVDGLMHVRGMDKPLKITLNSWRESDRIIVMGATTVGLQDLGIPDPSILVASVRDAVEIDFRIELDASLLAE